MQLTHLNSEVQAAHHQTPRVRSSFPLTKELLDRSVFKTSHMNLDKKTQASNLSHLFKKIITIIWLKEELNRLLCCFEVCKSFGTIFLKLTIDRVLKHSNIHFFLDTFCDI